MGLCVPSIKHLSMTLSTPFCDEVHICIIDVFGLIPIQKLKGKFWRSRKVGVGNKQKGKTVKIDKLERALRRMPNKALIRFVKRCVCKILLGFDNTANEAREELDLVYVECSRRGQERLYDTAYATVSRHPERCDIY